MLVDGFGHDAQGRGHGERDDRQVDQEHRPPAEGGHQRAAGQRPGRQGECGHARPDADRLRLLGPAGIGARDHGECAGQ